MGGIGAATAAGTGAYNLLNGRRTARRNIKSARAAQEQQQRKRINLLEEQMASRRAALGAAGLSSSPSALAANQRNIKNTLLDAKYDNERYNSQISQIKQDRSANYYNYLLKDVMPVGEKIIK